MHYRHQQPRHQPPRQHGDTLLEPPYQPPPVYYYPPAPAPVVERRPSIVGAFVGGLIMWIVGVAVKAAVVVVVLVAMFLGALWLVGKGVDALPDGTTTTTSAP